FQELPKTQNDGFRFRLDRIKRCPRQDDQKNDRGDAGDRPHWNAWHSRHLKSLNGGRLVHREQFDCVCESVDGPPPSGKAESAKSCVTHAAKPRIRRTDDFWVWLRRCRRKACGYALLD